jgi:hypothetical protein
MKTREEYVFTNLEQDLENEFTTIHKDICQSLTNFQKLTSSPVRTYIQSFLNLLKIG